MHRILIVEDEEHIREALKLNLELEGFEVVTADNGKTALQLFLSQHFDLILMDVMLPEVDGLQAVEQIRLYNSEVPVLMLTAKDTTQDRVNGLRRGADDYVTKPFSLEELLLRLHKLLRRAHRPTAEASEVFRFGANEVNFKTYEARSAAGTFQLTKKEAMLLKLLIERRNEVVSRQQILQAVWGYDVYPSTRTIDNFILSFRKYFETDPRNPVFFHSIRGVGYRFALEGDQ